MIAVKFILFYASFRAEKDFQRSSRPFEGDEEYIRLRPEGGYVAVKIRWVRHYAQEDFYEVICDDAASALCRLYLAEKIDNKFSEDNDNWKMENFAEFELDPAIVKEIKKINDYRKNIA